MEEEFDIAQICLNGHVINSSVKDFSQFCKKFCDKCSARTITECQECKAEIQGRYKNSISISPFLSPKYCSNCGKPFPWTLSKIEAAHELAMESALSNEEKEILNKSIDEIVKETPKTELEATKFKKIMLKLEKEAAEIFKSILVRIASKTAKKIIWGL